MMFSLLSVSLSSICHFLVSPLPAPVVREDTGKRPTKGLDPRGRGNGRGSLDFLQILKLS
jgi:hypothetical protein